MALWAEIKQRRITQIVVTYLAAGWMALAVVDQVVDREVLAPVFYEVALTLYLFGSVAALVVGWYHGEKGAQKAPASEIVALGLIALACIGVSGQVIRASTVGTPASISGPDLRRLAVLYFEDLSPDGALAPVADGISEALIEQLGGVRSLDVISRNGVLPFRDAGLRPDSVARALSVGTLIEGSVDRRGDRLRITTRLVDGFSGADLGRELVEIPADAFLAARDSVAERVSGLLRERLGEEVQLRELRAGTASQEAWTLAQRAERLRTDAEDHFDSGGDVGTSIALLEEADSLLGLAETMDPEWVKPVAARARVAYRRAWMSAGLGDMGAAEELTRGGLAHADRALTLDPEDPAALEQRGTLRLFSAVALGPTREELGALLGGAQTDLETAVRIDPSLATAHDMLSFYHTGMSDHVSAVLSARRALEEDAYLRGADRIYERLVYAQFDLEQLRDSRTWCDEGARRFPDNHRFVECQLWLMASPAEDPDVTEAWALLDRLVATTPESLRGLKRGVGQVMVAGVLRKAELPDSAESVLARVDHGEGVDPQRQLFVLEAAIRANTGSPDLDGALEALRRWIAATPGSTLGSGGELHWWWRPLRSRPGFDQFVSRGG